MRSSLTSGCRTVASYCALAPLYDRIMHHVRYDEWVSLIQTVVANYAATPDPLVLELGGGTGTLGLKLQRAGMRYVGSDACPAMCSIARGKAVPWVGADCRSLPFRRMFDLVIFLYDGINYLCTLSEYDRLFETVHRQLSPGGLFLFDVTTTANSLRNFSEYVERADFDDSYFVRHSYYDAAAQLQYNDFTIFVKQGQPGDGYQRVDEQHVQRVFPITVLRDQIPPDRFDVLGVWDDFTFKKCTRKSERVHFLLRKKAAD